MLTGRPRSVGSRSRYAVVPYVRPGHCPQHVYMPHYLQVLEPAWRASDLCISSRTLVHPWLLADKAMVREQCLDRAPLADVATYLRRAWWHQGVRFAIMRCQRPYVPAQPASPRALLTEMKMQACTQECVYPGACDDPCRITIAHQLTDDSEHVEAVVHT